MKNKLLVVAAIAALGAAGTVNAAGDAEAGKAKSAACAACHGQDGNSPAPNFPKLAGQHPGYMVKQLKDFKAGKRKDATMAPMALPLSEQDMEDIAAYFSAQKKQMGAADEKLVERGQALYRGGDAAEGI
ncbi:MAG TPA: cytochrome c, partial [Thiotrichales bacterium]|nr:cytochrome c [Thiotrichales bacterium]